MSLFSAFALPVGVHSRRASGTLRQRLSAACLARNRSGPRIYAGTQRRVTMSETKQQVPKPDAPELPEESTESVVGKMPVYAQCMLRIHWPEESRKFYEDLLGMTQLTRFDFPDAKFSLFFYAYTKATPPEQSKPQSERADWLWSRPEPTIELTWNWEEDTYEESLQKVKDGYFEPQEQYANGNEEPKGFGYVQISVSDVDAAVSGLRDAGVEVIKDVAPDPSAEPFSVAVVAEPNGYHVRLVGPAKGGDARPVPELDPVFSSVMIRVKEASKAIPFFNRLGFSVVARQDRDDERATDFYLAMSDKSGDGAAWAYEQRACSVTVRQEWGMEYTIEHPYTNGNTRPFRGFGHVGITVDDVYDAMDKLEKAGHKVVRKPSPFADVGSIAFIAEPSSDYWVEVINRAGDAPQIPYEQPKL